MADSHTASSVVIVAPYASERAGLRGLVEQNSGWRVVGEVSGSEDLRRSLSASRPDLLVVDATHADIEAVVTVAETSVLPLVALGDSIEQYRTFQRRALPGWAFLLKGAEPEEVSAALGGAAAGLVVLNRASAAVFADHRTPSGAAGPQLTPRERQVLQLMALGLPNKNIAARLSVSLHTVKFHVASILAKLGAGSRTEAVTIGARTGEVIL